MHELITIFKEINMTDMILGKIFGLFLTFRSIIVILSIQTNDNHQMYFKDIDQLKMMLAFDQFEEPNEQRI
jgi:hypothetical protein